MNFGEQGLATEFPQHSVSVLVQKGDSARHAFPAFDPHGEVKLVRCLTGAIWDVIIDIRPGSPTFRQSRGFELIRREWLAALHSGRAFAHGLPDAA